MSCGGRSRLTVFLATVLAASAWLCTTAPAAAQDDARTRQLRLLCAQLSGDLTDPGGIAAFRRCLTTRDPVGEIHRDNDIGGSTPPAVADRPGAGWPKGFGHDSRRELAGGVRRFATHDRQVFYATDKDNKLWRFVPANKDAHVVDDNVADFGCLGDGTLLVLGTDGRLSHMAVGTEARLDIDARSLPLANAVNQADGAGADFLTSLLPSHGLSETQRFEPAANPPVVPAPR